MFLFDRIHEVSAAMASRDPLRCLRLNDSLSHAAPWQLNELTREFSWTTQRVGGVAGAKRFALEPDTVRAMVSVLSSPLALSPCRAAWRSCAFLGRRLGWSGTKSFVWKLCGRLARLPGRRSTVMTW
jgi:hypothetical protein